MATHAIGPHVLRFIAQLKRNNNREWFQKNKARYEQELRDPLLRFIEAFAPRLRKISPHFVADPRPVGGSLFRIYRDTRFSKDKSPYKTHAGVQFRHERAKDVHAPGFYLHIEPRQVFCGVGIWHPDGPTLAKLRAALVDDPAGWKRARNAKRFVDRFTLGGESLKRPPRGFDPDHPLIEDLMRKDFIASVQFPDKALESAKFVDQFAATCADAKPFMRFLAKAVGLEF